MRTLFKVIMIGCLMSLFAGVVHLEVSNEQIALAVLGEAYHDAESMRYMAHAVINRVHEYGGFKGVYGYEKAKRVNWSLKTRETALKAVNKAMLKPDVTHGSTHWLSDYDLSHCKPSLMAWRFKMVETAYQGQTHYYKEV